MSVLAIILIVLGVLALVFFLGGLVYTQRRHERDRGEILRLAAQADQHLAEAVASDRGWERTTMEAVARRAYADRRGAEPSQLMLIKVVDLPGTAEDTAVFRADGDDITLERRDGEWVAQ